MKTAVRKVRAPAITEEQVHRQVFQYLDWALIDGALAFHVPNGGTRNLREAKKLKSLGVRAGVPDIVILHQGKALFIELKSSTGVLSASQMRTIPLIEKAGCRVYVCRSLQDVEAVLDLNRVPTRAEPVSTTRIRRGFEKAMAP